MPTQAVHLDEQCGMRGIVMVAVALVHQTCGGAPKAHKTSQSAEEDAYRCFPWTSLKKPSACEVGKLLQSLYFLAIGGTRQEVIERRAVIPAGSTVDGASPVPPCCFLGRCRVTRLLRLLRTTSGATRKTRRWLCKCLGTETLPDRRSAWMLQVQTKGS